MVTPFSDPHVKLRPADLVEDVTWTGDGSMHFRIFG